jgi:antitoxin HicB
MKYLVKIHWSDEDHCYIATVPALSGCISHGETLEEAAAAIHQASDLWLASAMKHGDNVPFPDLAAEEIARLAPILNLSKLARLSGMNQHTLSTKIRRGSRFTPEEGEKLLAAIGG